MLFKHTALFFKIHSRKVLYIYIYIRMEIQERERKVEYCT